MTEGKPVQAAVRLPVELHARLKELAEEDRRSLHAEILVLLEEALAARAELQDVPGKMLAAA